MKAHKSTPVADDFIKSHLSTIKKVADSRKNNGSEDIDRYVVYIQLRKSHPENKHGQFFFCGYVR